MRMNFRRLAGGIAVAAAMLCTTQISSAQSLGADTISLFPKNVGEFAYANLKQARSQKWFPQLQEQMLPERFKQFEKFLASAGVDPNSQVEELAWGLVAEGVTDKTSGTGSAAVPTGEEVVGVALGSYNPQSTEAYFKAQKLPTFKSHGFTMYAFGSGTGAADSAISGSGKTGYADAESDCRHSSQRRDRWKVSSDMRIGGRRQYPGAIDDPGVCLPAISGQAAESGPGGFAGARASESGGRPGGAAARVDR